MGISRIRAVERRKKKDVETALKWVLYPPAIAGALLFGVPKKKNRRRKKWK